MGFAASLSGLSQRIQEQYPDIQRGADTVVVFQTTVQQHSNNKHRISVQAALESSSCPAACWIPRTCPPTSTEHWPASASPTSSTTTLCHLTNKYIIYDMSADANDEGMAAGLKHQKWHRILVCGGTGDLKINE